jgi:hypothetical protein
VASAARLAGVERQQWYRLPGERLRGENTVDDLVVIDRQADVTRRIEQHIRDHTAVRPVR